MREGLPDARPADAMTGALLGDAPARAGTPSRDGSFETMPDVMPEWLSDPLAGEAMPDSAVLDALAPDDLPPDWPPDAVPVVLWPEETLREALQGAPGVGLARVVAEALDLAGNLHPGHTGSDPGGDAGGDAGGGVLGGLSDDALGDLVNAAGRLQSWAAGIQALVVAERAARETHPLAHSSLVGQVTAELVVTEPEATQVVTRAESGTRHPTVIQALVAGRIDVRKAHTLLRSASQLTVAERAEAIRIYLPRAPRRTWKWLQTRMLAFAKDRHGAANTAKTAAQQRCVQLDRAENDMGWLSAYLPATDAAAVWGVVDDMAHQLKHVAGEDRTLGQLRADSLTGIITGRLLPADRYTDTTDTTATDTSDTSRTSRTSSTSTEGGTAGGGMAGGAEATGSVAGAGAGTSIEGAATPATGGRVDASAADAGGADRAGDGLEEPTCATDTPVCTCGGRAPVIQHVEQVVQETVQVVRITPTRPVLRVTIPASALLGLDNTPGHLDGYGPIPAQTARLIATDATWQRLLTDPATGILTDYSTTTYQPGRVLRTAIETRDTTCTFLWDCDTPANRCDLDHIQPFDHTTNTSTGKDTGTTSGPGQTRAHNLHALCRKHHLLKTHAGWGVIRDPATGITTWTTPAGRTYTRPPTVLDTHIDIDQIEPDTSHDLTLRALTGQRLPRVYRTTEPGTIPSTTDEPADADPSEPPF